MNVFNKVTISFLNMQYATGGTVELNTPKVLFKYELHSAFLFPNINPVEFG